MSVSLAKKVSLVKPGDSESRGFYRLGLDEYIRCLNTLNNYNDLKS